MEISKLFRTIFLLLTLLLSSCSSLSPVSAGSYGNLKRENVNAGSTFEIVNHHQPFGLKFKSEYLGSSNEHPLFSLVFFTRSERTIGILKFYRKECDGLTSFIVDSRDLEGASYQYYDDKISVHSDITISSAYVGVEDRTNKYRVSINGVDVDLRSRSKMNHITVISHDELKVDVLGVMDKGKIL